MCDVGDDERGEHAESVVDLLVVLVFAFTKAIGGGLELFTDVFDTFLISVGDFDIEEILAVVQGHQAAEIDGFVRVEITHDEAAVDRRDFFQGPAKSLC